MSALSLNAFKEYLTDLDVRLSASEYKTECPVEIYAIGGFSLMYYGLRFSGTEDIDSVKLLKEPVKKLVRKTPINPSFFCNITRLATQQEIVNTLEEDI